MRAYRLIFVLFLLAGCKSTVQTSSINYEEDLSVHRPDLISVPVEKGKENEFDEKEVFIPLKGSIKEELDSIAKISYQENKAGKLVDGFMIQIYSGSSRSDATDVMNKANELFPELNPQISYRQPSFRVKAGQFTDRLEANRVFQTLKQEFPRALLIPERFTLVYE